MNSYHDLYVTTALIPRTRLFELPFKYIVTCTRAGGWELRLNVEDKLLAGEFHTDGLRLDVDGVVIVDSLTPAIEGPSYSDAG